MYSTLAQEAAEAALARDWKKAISINKKILEHDPQNTDALNRISRAYAEKGEIDKAKKISKKVLKIDPMNTIAQKCIQKWENFKRDSNLNPASISASSFIEESTKTKEINLINLGEKNKISCLECGDKVNLIANGRRVSVETCNNVHLGRFPDDIAYKFTSLIKLGGSYEAVIKSANQKEVRIFVKFSPKTGY